QWRYILCASVTDASKIYLECVFARTPGRCLARRIPSPIFRRPRIRNSSPLGVTLDISRAPAAAPAQRNLAGLSRAELAQALVEAAVVRTDKARMRASQLWRWIHHYGVTDFAAMTDVAKETRAALAETFTLARPEVVERQVSRDGTRKWLIRMAPGIEVETVYI